MPNESPTSRWLVTTDWLAARLGAPTTVVVDGSFYLPAMKRDAAAEYLAEHIPGAVRFDIDVIADHSNPLPHMLPDAELAAAPGLIKTMSVKPPTGTGRVRLIEIVGYDLQPCGGTHVRTTNEIGDVRVTQIEKKGKQNRRVRIAFA